jgi:UDP-N-acetylmuramate dehydrogenase
MMKIQENILLKDLTTFKIGGRARYFVIAKNTDDLREAFAFVKTRRLPFFILGGGSNLLISDNDFPGLVIKNEIKGFKFIDLLKEKDQDQADVLLEIGSGELLDEIIALAVSRNLSGLENLSGIPGSIGGAAVQNAGAYGTEFKDILFSIEGLNSLNGKNFIFKKEDCKYGYRDSLFKKNKKYVITTITLRLNKKPLLNIEYAGLKKILTKESEITVIKIREAILKIREEKLPDWHKIPTAGSFFKNPIITEQEYLRLKEKYSDIPSFLETKNKVKVPLAWILDNVCDLKGYREGNVGLYHKQPLILVNLGSATAVEIKKFSEKIKNIVKEKTNIKIEEEVENI